MNKPWSSELPTEEKPKRKYNKNSAGVHPPLPLRKPMHPISRAGSKIQRGMVRHNGEGDGLKMDKHVTVKEAERLLDEVGAMTVKELYDLGKRFGYHWIKGQRKDWLQKRMRRVLQEEVIDHAKRKART